MTVDLSIIQIPEPGRRMVRFRGDMVAFELALPAPREGSAWVRSNIGGSAITREEIFRQVEFDETPLGRGWSDVPMTRVDGRRYRLTLPLWEVGHFEAKCLFIPEDEIDPLWPAGDNTAINVEPADTICANIIYNAFVRQFGPNKAGTFFKDLPGEYIERLDAKGFNVIPPSGTFRDLIKELDFIMGTLGCRIIQLLPIHPTPTTFARMGRFGSPYASLNFTTVDSALAEFDPAATPLDQFIELVDAVHRRNGKLLIDIAVNHTGWGADIHELHPRWLVRDDEGRIQNPGAWGVVWEDLTKLDYTQKDLWIYIADVFLAWCRRGVDGFRCDAGYMIPETVWQYVIARVREQFPDTLFFLEGLGGKISVTRSLLNTGNFNWAYSELFQNYDRGQIEHYLPEAVDLSAHDGLLIHFAETHDNLRLAAKSREYALMRTALCALSSCCGGFGFANGVEWFATEKIVVHESHSLNWGARTNMVSHIQTLSRLLRNHPAFHDRTQIQLVQVENGNCVALLRYNPLTGTKLLVLANLDADKSNTVSWPGTAGFNGPDLFDLLSQKHIAVKSGGGKTGFSLAPAQVLCLTADSEDFNEFALNESDMMRLPDKILNQRLKAKVLETLTSVNGLADFNGVDIDAMTRDLSGDPESFCRGLNQISDETRTVVWHFPNDLAREIMVPPDHFLLIRSEDPFRVRLICKDRIVALEESLPLKEGGFFALFPPHPVPEKPTPAFLKLTVFTGSGTRKGKAPLRLLPRPDISDNPPLIENLFKKADIRKMPLIFLSTNGRGAMSRFCLSWGEPQSRYDAILAANPDPDTPVNRHIMFTRCRAWIVYQGYSQDVNIETLDLFYFKKGAGYWQFEIPTGKGSHVILTVKGCLVPGKNAVLLSFYRRSKCPGENCLDDDMPVRLILRPDIEDRSFHDVTKAYTGPEKTFTGAVQPLDTGFRFAPGSGQVLDLEISEGRFAVEPEWQYMVHHPTELGRGLDPDSDLFSPGYFSCLLRGNHRIILSAATGPVDHTDMPDKKTRAHFSEIEFPDAITKLPLEQGLSEAMDAYIVKRGNLKSVIAGYPWFLDWGRDSLIFARGMIAAGKTDAARSVIRQFGLHEENGTLPNMIVGSDAGNRDTSDAPLWFAAACADLIAHEKSMDFLDESCGNRTIRDVLLSIGNAYSSETPNGIRMDPESALIYSPAHYTWMDTNFPAGTPRQGYPIEIQALWHKTLKLLAVADGRGTDAGPWQHLAKKLEASAVAHFYFEDAGYLADCLHAGPDTPADKAERDDALRPNQLLAVTMGLVSDLSICRNILTTCTELLIPGAIRSLADRPTARPLAIYHHGKLLNNPALPYQGRYEGDEDTRRKPAYHNGTAWTWIFPSFSEAWALAYGSAGCQTALSLLCSGTALINAGCVGQVPEIADGDYPHSQRGCDAQAWGVSELLRVFIFLKKRMKS